jgi:BlaI family transcriptional regulator, penicillinase repressor
MKSIPKISDAEWQIMRVLWTQSPLAASEIIGALAASTTWKPKTVMTLVNRLVIKKAVGFHKKGRAYHYYPLVDEDVCVKAESRSFLQRVYGGALKPMLAALFSDSRLSRGEIEELKSLLDQKANKK